MKNFFKKYKLFIAIGAVLLTIFTIVFLLMSGEKKTPPLEDPALVDNGVDVSGPSQPKPSVDEVSSLIKQPLGYHKNYRISITSKIGQEIDSLKKEYSSFLIKESDSLPLVEKFIKDIGKDNLLYQKNSPTPDYTTHFWSEGSDSISYSSESEVLFMTFSQPILISGIQFEPRNEKSMEKSLSEFFKKYFAKNSEYKVKGFSMQENYYKVEFSRLLNGIPLDMEIEGEYLLLTPDGRLREAKLLLAEFEEYGEGKFGLISSVDLSRNISSREYPKNVHFRNIDPLVEEAYDVYGYILFSDPYTQTGSMEAESVELIYLFVNTSQEMVVPVFFLEGTGLLDVEGTMASSDFLIYASALHSKYVYIHSDSHFRNLEY